LRIEIARGQTAEGYLLIPDGKGPFPAVLVPYYEPETSVGLSTNKFRDFAFQLTKRSFVTLSIGSPGGDARKPETGQVLCQPLSFLACIAANVATRWRRYETWTPNVSVSLDIPTAASGPCSPLVFTTSSRAVSGLIRGLSSTRRVQRELLGTVVSRQRSHPQTKARRAHAGGPSHRRVQGVGRGWSRPARIARVDGAAAFLVSGGSEDTFERWRALNHVVAVNRLLGQTNRVAMTSRSGHTPTPESNEQLCLFFEHFLKETSAGQ